MGKYGCPVLTCPRSEIHAASYGTISLEKDLIPLIAFYEVTIMSVLQKCQQLVDGRVSRI